MNETTDRFRGILRRLLEKSRRDEVRWERAIDESAGRERRTLREYAELAAQADRKKTKEKETRTFAVRFADADATIAVTFVSPTAAPDFAQANLVVNNEPVARLEAEDGGNMEDFALLYDLWQDAHRRIYGWDQTLEKLESALQSEGTVGATM